MEDIERSILPSDDLIDIRYRPQSAAVFDRATHDEEMLLPLTNFDPRRTTRAGQMSNARFLSSPATTTASKRSGSPPSGPQRQHPHSRPASCAYPDPALLPC